VFCARLREANPFWLFFSSLVLCSSRSKEPEMERSLSEDPSRRAPNRFSAPISERVGRFRTRLAEPSPKRKALFDGPRLLNQRRLFAVPPDQFRTRKG
jgi:hypothetical protein